MSDKFLELFQKSHVGASIDEDHRLRVSVDLPAEESMTGKMFLAKGDINVLTSSAQLCEELDEFLEFDGFSTIVSGAVAYSGTEPNVSVAINAEAFLEKSRSISRIQVGKDESRLQIPPYFMGLIQDLKLERTFEGKVGVSAVVNHGQGQAIGLHLLSEAPVQGTSFRPTMYNVGNDNGFIISNFLATPGLTELWVVLVVFESIGTLHLATELSVQSEGGSSLQYDGDETDRSSNRGIISVLKYSLLTDTSLLEEKAVSVEDLESYHTIGVVGMTEDDGVRWHAVYLNEGERVIISENDVENFPDDEFDDAACNSSKIAAEFIIREIAAKLGVDADGAYFPVIDSMADTAVSVEAEVYLGQEAVEGTEEVRINGRLVNAVVDETKQFVLWARAFYEFDHSQSLPALGITELLNELHSEQASSPFDAPVAVLTIPT
jgi:hypothetical protein